MRYLELYAIRVSQPLSDFYLASIKARDLLKLTFSEKLEYMDENGKLKGNQRKIDERRLKEIGKYIDSVEMSFPNSIILAANYSEEGELVDDEKYRWDIDSVEENLYKIIIPSDKKLAAVIDGQHRLMGFGEKYLPDQSKLDVELPCAIFFDLPISYQAFLFATINGNQKRVDKSLALEQFGFNVEDEPQHTWTPEKLAVFFTRRLNFKDSPIKGHIKIAPKISSALEKQVFATQKEWSISTATIVEGILNLITSNAKRDRVEMARENIWGNRTRKMVDSFKNDKSPLRQEYLDKNDEYIFKVIFNFLSAAKNTIWKDYDPKSYIFKTVGVQALFDILKRILQHERLTEEYEFETYLETAMKYDFSSSSVQASGIGRRDIRNAILYSTGLVDEKPLKPEDLKKIKDFER
ncbi:DNA phosphorothioation-associated DGQHR protein 1 [Parapedobacter luteus]|uniref:DNA phosphorothioation-associated DGQHR protein 1 n=1 Tax=Parapedobacter luteus TaxID=623280 RepID=A0A1T5CTN2_9SPHI|nr:DNA phosphorothioation-associated DGQHR protein 1 [Parapedobacter luteus]SKB62693.1 DNA phosphorothioation-associated DGQHR protein 1 [Parapedobacter luteus]